MASETGNLTMQILPNDVLEKVKVDWFKNAIAFMVARLLLKQNIAGLTDKDWQISTLLVLLGFTVYQMAVARFFDTSSVTSGPLKNALDDVLKFGTMLVVSQLLAGKSLADQAWMKSTAFTLVGFVAFDLVTYRLSDMMSGTPKQKLMVSDAVKFGTMFTVSRYLSGQPFNTAWMLENGGFIGGLMIYDYFFTA